MDLEEAAEQVYAATPEEFMAVRTSLVKQARAARDRELAKSIGALRKPTKSAWMINLLARSAADEVAALLDLGAALREAQASLSGPELRRLSGERQKAVRALARQAAALAAEHDHRATDAQLQEVSQHLQAALADPGLAEDVRAGRVTQIVTFGGFGPWEAGPGDDGAGTTSRPATSTETADPAESDTAATAGTDEGSAPQAGPTEADLRESDLREARADWEQTQGALRAAESASAEAVETAEAASEAAAQLRTQLAAAEQAASDADGRREEAEHGLAIAQSSADRASQRLEELLSAPSSTKSGR